ncbi:hypothetical protein KQX54_020945 [Cotesia glomerata]|uniref:Uncharacterized protein n=1 Tax=Cotesia glomerata TaxID=32391 RepID=A0AAV7J881_COTGL|nr:hypothetical protein KQX54_020945 [Cotesia glomerata]
MCSHHIQKYRYNSLTSTVMLGMCVFDVENMALVEYSNIGLTPSVSLKIKIKYVLGISIEKTWFVVMENLVSRVSEHAFSGALTIDKRETVWDFCRETFRCEEVYTYLWSLTASSKGLSFQDRRKVCGLAHGKMSSNSSSGWFPLYFEESSRE